MNVECTSSVTAEQGDYLTAEVVAEWVTGLPPGAHLSPVLYHGGTQRDPITTLSGLRAVWSEQRL